MTAASRRALSNHANHAQSSEAATHGKWLPIVAGLALLTLAALLLADRLYHPQQFRIQEIEVHGQFSRVNGEQVKQVVEQSLAGNYFSLSLRAVETRIAQLPWVFRVSVRRQWPATLVVEVVEVQPIANWGADQWLHVGGELVPREADADTPHLPLLLAADRQQPTVWRAFTSWSEMFAKHGLRLQQLRLDRRAIWYLTLSANAAAPEHAATVTVVVEQHRAQQQMQRLMKTLPQHLLREFAAIRAIDLRYPNGFAVSWRDSAVAPSGHGLAKIQPSVSRQ